MTDDDDSPIFERGDVVFGADPFKGEIAARPWVIVSNHEARPFHGEQYIALTLTTKSWLDGVVEIPESLWLEGGTPAESRIVPWGVQSIHRDDIGHWQGEKSKTTSISNRFPNQHESNNSDWGGKMVNRDSQPL